MILLLPEPPSLNAYYTVQRRGRFFAKVVTKKGIEYQKLIFRYKKELNLPCLHGDLSVVMDCFPHSRNSRDIDNYFKALLDSLQYAGIIENDNMIRSTLGRMQQPNRKWPCVLLQIEKMDWKPKSLSHTISSEDVKGIEMCPNHVRSDIENFLGLFTKKKGGRI